MLKRLFLVNTDDSRHWVRILLWWEFRRPLYNILLVLFGILSLTLLSYIVKDLWSFFSDFFLFYLATAVLLLLANVLYTGGWIFQLLTRNSQRAFIRRIRPRLFVYGLLFSFAVELLPCLLTGGYSLITGERIQSPFADFATHQPDANDLVGTYVIADASRKQLHLPDSVSGKTVIRFKADKTFEFRYFPYHGFGSGLSDYELVNASGKWNVEEDEGSWVIPMDYDTIIRLRTGETDSSGLYDVNSFHINSDAPPYAIYIVVGDPDSWEGITLEKR